MLRPIAPAPSTHPTTSQAAPPHVTPTTEPCQGGVAVQSGAGPFTLHPQSQYISQIDGSGQDLQPRPYIPEIRSLQTSHSLLAQEIATLKAEMSNTIHSLLQKSGVELGRRVAPLVSANCVVQVTLKSAATDCTLAEFQAFALTVLSKRRHCTASPSAYHIRFPNLQRCPTLQLSFSTYADICDVLDVDGETRHAAVFRERSLPSGGLRAVQVTGTEIMHGTSRIILLGHSYPKEPTDSQILCLHQQSTEWFDNSFSVDFTFRTESSTSIRNRLQLQAAPSSTTAEHKTPAVYAITWQPLETSAPFSKHIPGYVRAFFPAVVLRSNKLTRCVQSIFCSNPDIRTKAATPSISV